MNRPGRDSRWAAVAYGAAGALVYPVMDVLAHGFSDDVLVQRALQCAAGTGLAMASLALFRHLREQSLRQVRRVNEVLEDQVAVRTEELRREIAERARAEESLRQSEQRFRDIAETAGEWLWEMGPDLRFTYLSRRFAEATGLTADDILGRPPEDVFDGSGGNSLRAQLGRRRAFRDVEAGLTGAAAGRNLRWSGRPIIDGAGVFRGFRGIGADLSAERQALASYELLRARHDSMLKTMVEGVVILDHDGRVLLQNPAAEEILGWPWNALEGRNLADTLCRETGDSGESIAAVIAGAAARRGRGETFRRGDGALLGVDYVCAPLFETGRPAGAVLVFHDVAERLRAEGVLLRAKEQAEEATRAKSEFIAHLSHQLRIPLNAIIGFADVVLAELFGALNPKYRDYVADIHQSGQHLIDLLADIVDLSRIEAGRLELVEQPVDISEVMDSAMEILKADAIRAGCQLNNSVPGNLPRIQADPRRLKQVLLNILSNAVKYTPSGGRITATAEVDAQGGLVLRLTDTGIGIPPKALSRITEPFGQGDLAVSKKQAGAGLGLPLAKRLMDLHGGRLEVASTLHVGTTITLGFPPVRLLVTG